MEGIATRWFLSSTKVVEEYEENVTLYGRVSSRRLFRQQIVTNHRWRTSEVRVNTVNKADEMPSRDFPFDRVRSVLELVPWIILYTWRSFLFAPFDRPRVYLWWSVDMKTLFDIIRSFAIFPILKRWRFLRVKNRKVNIIHHDQILWDRTSYTVHYLSDCWDRRQYPTLLPYLQRNFIYWNENLVSVWLGSDRIYVNSNYVKNHCNRKNQWTCLLHEFRLYEL